MTENHHFKLVATTMDIPKTRLRDTIPVTKERFLDLNKQIYEKALENLIVSLKEVVEEDVSYEVLRAFAITYFDLEVTQDYDVKTMEYTLICTPKWKDVNEIDMTSKEFKLIEEYAWEVKQ